MPRYIAFDVETPNRFNSRMSAIGISVLENGRIVDSFYSLVDPEQDRVDHVEDHFLAVAGP